jgi:hypothetical protein
MIIGTLHTSNDSDSDSLPDPWELQYGLDPLDPSDATGDIDGDGLLNLEEFNYNTNPLLADSDTDRMPDLWEIENGLDPTVDDSLEDPDKDLVTNVQEYEEGTDPNFAEFRPERLVLPVVSVSSGSIVLVAGVLMFRRRK